MKLNKKLFIIPLSFCIIIYLLGAFIAVSFDIAEWDAEGRAVAVFSFAIAIVLRILISQE